MGRTAGVRARPPSGYPAGMLLLAFPVALAVEGMWEPGAMLGQAEGLRAAGFSGDPQALARLDSAPLAAVVSLGGCTGSFVSADGLLVTNHHCVVDSLQQAQKEGENLVKTGFFAATRADERSAGPGSSAWVTTGFKDVTAAVNGRISGATRDIDHTAILDANKKALVSACEKDGSTCSVASYYEGLRYTLITQLEIKDLRLVEAPPDMVGNYGDETDNWHWPRHSGDWSFYRAYVGKDGRPAVYSPENVPYHPKAVLTLAKRGPEPGEFVMLAGYPGATQRWETAVEVQRAAAHGMPDRIAAMDWTMQLLSDQMKADPATEPLLSATRFGLSNYRFFYAGVLASFTRTGLVERVVARDAGLDAWIAADAGRKARFTPGITELRARVVARDATRERDHLMSWLGRDDLLGTAQTLVRYAHERQKPDAKREVGYQERDADDILASMNALDAHLHLPTSRLYVRHFALAALALPDGHQIAGLRTFFGVSAGNRVEAAVDARLDGMYAAPALASAEIRRAMLIASPAEIGASTDGFLQLAVALYPYAQAREQERKEDAGATARTRPVYAAALQQFDNAHATSDANGTLRLSYGTVQGYRPRDGIVYQPQTTVHGIVEKAGAFPYDAPKALLDAIALGKWGPWADPALGAVPVDFLTDLDITGGNSGSPTLNARGELVGLAFDGNYEGIASDWAFDPSVARSIHVDIRYLLWYLHAVEGADVMLTEMGVALPP